MTTKEWLAWVSKNSSLSEIGEVAKVSKSTLSRRSNDGMRLSAEDVIKISEAYGFDPVQALRDTGHLPQEPHKETPEQLAERIKADVDRLASKLQESNIIPLHPNQDSDVHQAPYSDEELGNVAYHGQDIDQQEDDDHIP